MTFHQLLSAILFILVTESVGLLAGFFTTSSLSPWYESLQKPFFTPPNELFGPVWTILYLLMGFAAFIVYDKDIKTKRGRRSLLLFWIQLSLNALWTILFFGMQMPQVAFVEIIFLWVCIFFTIVRFYRTSHFAGILLIPYLLWVKFAAILNFAIVIMN